MRKIKYNRAGKLHYILQDISILLCLVLALGVLALGFEYVHNQEERTVATTQPPVSSKPVLADVAHKGIWFWQSPSSLTDESTKDILNVLQTDGINNIYIDISSYASFYELPDQTEKQAKILELQKNLQAFTRTAHGYNVKVHGLAGHTTWGTSSEAYIPPLYVDFVNQYNQSAQENEKLAGMQFDIESYNEPAFNANKKDGLLQYMAMVNTTLQRYKDTNSSFMLGFTIPYWFDNENGNIPEITQNKKTAPVAYHLFDSLNTIQNGYVAIMDYRNTTDGKDGSIAHAQNEVAYTSKYAPNVKVIIGQETTDVQPAKISFFSKTNQDFITATQRISSSFQPFSSYQGIAIHDYDGYVALRKKSS